MNENVWWKTAQPTERFWVLKQWMLLSDISCLLSTKGRRKRRHANHLYYSASGVYFFLFFSFQKNPNLSQKHSRQFGESPCPHKYKSYSTNIVFLPLTLVSNTSCYTLKQSIFFDESPCHQISLLRNGSYVVPTNIFEEKKWIHWIYSCVDSHFLFTSKIYMVTWHFQHSFKFPWILS